MYVLSSASNFFRTIVLILADDANGIFPEPEKSLYDLAF